MIGIQMMMIWTFLVMNPPRRKEEQVDNVELPRKGGVMVRLTSMMDDSDDDGLTFTCG